MLTCCDLLGNLHFQCLLVAVGFEALSFGNACFQYALQEPKLDDDLLRL